MLIGFPGLACCWRAGEFEAPVFAAMYFFRWQIASQGGKFAARKCKNDSRPDVAEWLTALETTKGEALRARLLGWLERYQFRGVSGGVPVTLSRWLRGAWPLILRQDIPTPLDVLRMQARGTRAVTALARYPRMREPVLNKPDAFAFFLHDLEHAYKFFHSTTLHRAQRAFFAALEAALDRGVFTPYLGNPEFAEKFHYLMSDMNTHPEHSRQYLRAILIEFYLRRDRKALSEPLEPAMERAIENVLRAVAIPVLLPDGAASVEYPFSDWLDSSAV